MHTLPALFLVLSLPTNVLCNSSPVLQADLTYGKFRGSYSPEYNISYWQKIPYAAPPMGKLRFRAPQPPLTLAQDEIYNSTQSYDYCPQRTTNGSEDCLYLGLYSRPWTLGQRLKPVVVAFHGGAFVQGGGSFSIPPSAYPILNVSDAGQDLMFVYPNYRLNAFGFLPGKEVRNDKGSDSNVGLLDQQAVLRWVQAHVQHFGGDPTQVTVWGQSAGGGSVVAQVMANGGRTRPKLFNRALASSPFWPKTYRSDAREAQELYDRFAEVAGCAGKESLKCLKQVDVQVLREASLSVSAMHTYNTSSYSWAPVIDGEFLTESLSKASAHGRVNTNVLWSMYNTHEGENFIPPGFQNSTGANGFNASEASFNSWLRGYLPGLSKRDLTKVEALYPASGTTEELKYNTTYERVGLIYRDTVLACPALWMASASSKDAYLGQYTIDPAKHASDTVYWNQINAIQKTDPLIYEGFAGAFASFFQTGDPNAFKLTNSSQASVPELHAEGEQFVIRSNGFVTTPADMLQRRCAFWQSSGSRVPV